MKIPSRPAINDSKRNSPRPLPPLAGATRPREHSEWIRWIAAGLFLYLFVCAINVMGGGLKMMGEAPDTKQWMESLFSFAHNPFVALTAAVLVTAIVQSSSFTTAMIITMAASGTLDVRSAVFAVMGANIGTSVTGIMVSLANIRIRRQFRRAFTAALVHDIFNLLTVAVIFPVEWATGILYRVANFLAQGVGLEAAGKPTNPVKVITKPVVGAFEWAGELLFANASWVGLTMAIGGLLLLFVSLVFMVGNLRGALLRQIEGLFRSVFFRNDALAGMVGMIATVLVQSSSVTTSLIVPLAGAGAVSLKQVFPFMLGANLGTTVTGLIAAAAIVHKPDIAFTVAFSHVLFNVCGILIWYPLRVVPMGAARWYGRLAARSKRYAFLFLLMVFIVIPAIGLLVTELLSLS